MYVMPRASGARGIEVDEWVVPLERLRLACAVCISVDAFVLLTHYVPVAFSVQQLKDVTLALIGQPDHDYEVYNTRLERTAEVALTLRQNGMDNMDLLLFESRAELPMQQPLLQQAHQFNEQIAATMHQQPVKLEIKSYDAIL